MSVEGYLEDLGVCEILQILSLSKKSGTLYLVSGDQDGSISFKEGQIVRATSNVFPQELGQLLRHCQLVTAQQLEQALVHQKQLKKHLPLGEILCRLFQIPTAAIEEAIARQIEKVILSFVALRAGTFRFSLEDTVIYGTASLNPLDLMLEKGMSPRRLALKGQRGLEQKAFDDASIDQELAEIDRRHSSKGLDLLCGMLAELEHPEFSGGVVLLILRYASEIMNHAVIFDLRGDCIVGIGQFGIHRRGEENADDLVRRMKLCLTPDSVFSEVLKTKEPYRGPGGTSSAETELRHLLGETSGSVYLAPLLNNGQVVAMLYGELITGGVAAAKVDAFNVFLAQAGLAIEQALQGN